MIATLALYTLGVSLLLGTSAWLLERVALARKWPTRWIWAAAMAGSLLLPLGSLARPRSFRASPRAATATQLVLARAVESAPTRVRSAARDALPARIRRVVRALLREGPVATLRREVRTGARALLPYQLRRAARYALARATRVDGALATLWGWSAVVGLAALALAAGRLARRRRGWWPAQVDDVPVLVSRDVGPAVVGALDEEIVLPAWVLTLPAEERALILAHEQEHVRAGDLRLTAAAVLAVLLAPWNLALWWQLRRMRVAIELDCDARVLRRHRDVRAYARLLLAVGARSEDRWFALAAFAERPSAIERRLVEMTTPVARGRVGRSLALLALAAAAVAVACAAPRPSRPAAAPHAVPRAATRVGALSAPSRPVSASRSASASAAASGFAFTDTAPAEPRAAAARAMARIDAARTAAGLGTGEGAAVRAMAAASSMARHEGPSDEEAAGLEGLGCGSDRRDESRHITFLVDPRDAARMGTLVVRGAPSGSGETTATLESPRGGSHCNIHPVGNVRVFGRSVVQGGTLTVATREPIEVRVETPDRVPVAGPFTVDRDTKDIVVTWNGRASRP